MNGIAFFPPVPILHIKRGNKQKGDGLLHNLWEDIIDNMFILSAEDTCFVIGRVPGGQIWFCANKNNQSSPASSPLRAREWKRRGLALIFHNTFLLNSDSFCQEEKKEKWVIGFRQIKDLQAARGEESHGEETHEWEYKGPNVLKGTQEKY